MTQTEVAKALGVSRQTIWNIENSALKKLREFHEWLDEPRKVIRWKP